MEYTKGIGQEQSYELESCQRVHGASSYHNWGTLAPGSPDRDFASAAVGHVSHESGLIPGIYTGYLQRYFIQSPLPPSAADSPLIS